MITDTRTKYRAISKNKFSVDRYRSRRLSPRGVSSNINCNINKGIRGGAPKLAHLLESASLKKNYMNKNYEKICIK